MQSLGSRRWRASPDVLARRVGDESVLLDTASGMYFGLNPVGAEIWELLVDGHSEAEIVQRLLERFEVDATVLSADFTTLLRELGDRGLVLADGACT